MAASSTWTDPDGVRRPAGEVHARIPARIRPCAVSRSTARSWGATRTWTGRTSSPSRAARRRRAPGLPAMRRGHPAPPLPAARRPGTGACRRSAERSAVPRAARDRSACAHPQLHAVVCCFRWLPAPARNCRCACSRNATPAAPQRPRRRERRALRLTGGAGGSWRRSREATCTTGPVSTARVPTPTGPPSSEPASRTDSSITQRCWDHGDAVLRGVEHAERFRRRCPGTEPS